MSFTENMYSDQQLAALVAECVKTSGLRGAVIEFGCWEGRSTVALANVCAPNILIAVDSWTGSAFGDFNIDLELGTDPEVVERARKRDVFTVFLLNVGLLTKGNVWPVRCDHDLYLTRMDSQLRFRFVHLDGAHDYEAVRRQITALKPRMVPGGIICGHDFHHEPVARAVQELCPGFRSDDDVWSWTA